MCLSDDYSDLFGKELISVGFSLIHQVLLIHFEWLWVRDSLELVRMFIFKEALRAFLLCLVIA